MGNMILTDIVIIIPALDPDGALITYCEALVKKGFHRFVLIDDGSAEEKKNIFSESIRLIKENGAEGELLIHEVNQGKGKALKDAFLFCADHYGEEDYAVITADSDGQHLPEDVLKLAGELGKDNDAIILGSRDFTLPNVPPKSKFGNTLTSNVFKIFLGLKINDTQTGLRGIPAKYLRALSTVEGDRFEYETRMFIWAKEHKVQILEMPIETVYENGNAGTHFNPVKDSIKIYGVIFGGFLKFAAGSLLSAILDIVLFSVFLNLLKGAALPVLLGKEIFTATVIARLCSALFNFTWNRKVVFHSAKNPAGQMMGYIVLMVFIMCSSGIMVTLLDGLLSAFIPVVLTKVLVDIILFIISYIAQKRMIFRD